MSIVRRPPPWLRLIAWGAVLAAGAWFTRPLPAAATRSSIGFSTLYTAGRLVLEGSSLSRAYDDAWFGAQVHRFAPSVPEIYRPNTPAASLIGVTVAWMDYRTARIVWTFLSIAVLFAITLWTIRYLDLGGLTVPGCTLFVLLFQPIRASLWYGQTYIVLLGILILGFEGLRRDRAPLAGCSLGSLFGLKLAVPLVALLLFKKRYRRTLVWTAAALAGICLLSLVRPGPDCWRAWFSYLRRPMSLTGWSAEAVTAYQTVPGFFAHLSRFDARWNPAPLFDAPEVGRMLSNATGLLLVIGSLARTARSTDPSIPTAMLTLAGLVLSPWTLDYHYPLAFLPIVIVGNVLSERAAGFSLWSVLVLGALLLCVPQRWYGVPALQSGALAFLAYPKLYGALIVWTLAFIVGGARVRSSPAAERRLENEQSS